MSTIAESHRHVFESSKEIADFVIKCILEVAQTSIAERGIFRLGVSGGSIINILAERLSKETDLEWNKWRVFFCDERLVPFNHPESTYGQFKTKLINITGSVDSWIPIDPTLDVEACATDYEKKVREVFGLEPPSFDMLLLGMGPDGHTCSLFPGHKLLQEEKLLIAPISDSPKPPSDRVTMTLPVLNNARNVLFISAGSSKADTIKKIFEAVPNTPVLPAGLVKPKHGVLRWVMDTSAASKI